MSTTNDEAQQLIDYLKAQHEQNPEISVRGLLAQATEVFVENPSEVVVALPPPSITRLWSTENGEETVNSWGGRVWCIRDLRAAVAGQPVFDLPLSLIPLREHSFDCPDIVEFARHMKHVNDADLEDPVIMDEYGWVMDGRHRIVRALVEGRHNIKCVKLPDGLNPSFYKTDSK